MTEIQIAQYRLLDVIDEAVKDFALEEATTNVGTEEYDPASVDEAMEYASDKTDIPEVYQAVDKIYRAVVKAKWEEYMAQHQQDWSDDKAKEQTDAYHRRVLR